MAGNDDLTHEELVELSDRLYADAYDAYCEWVFSDPESPPCPDDQEQADRDPFYRPPWTDFL